MLQGVQAQSPLPARSLIAQPQGSQTVRGFMEGNAEQRGNGCQKYAEEVRKIKTFPNLF